VVAEAVVEAVAVAVEVVMVARVLVSAETAALVAGTRVLAA